MNIDTKLALQENSLAKFGTKKPWRNLHICFVYIVLRIKSCAADIQRDVIWAINAHNLASGFIIET